MLLLSQSESLRATLDLRLNWYLVFSKSYDILIYDFGSHVHTAGHKVWGRENIRTKNRSFYFQSQRHYVQLAFSAYLNLLSFLLTKTVLAGGITTGTITLNKSTEAVNSFSFLPWYISPVISLVHKHGQP